MTTDFEHDLRTALRREAARAPRHSGRWTPEPQLEEPSPHRTTRVLLGAACLIVIAGIAGLIVTQRDTTPTTVIISDTAPSSDANGSAVPTETLDLAPVTTTTTAATTTEATTTPVTTTPVTTTTPSLPVLPFTPPPPSYGGADITPQGGGERFQYIYDVYGTHGPGHQFIWQMRAFPPAMNEETVVGCADWAMLDFYGIDQQAEAAIASLSQATGTPPDDITPDEIIRVLKATGAFEFDPAQLNYFILRCAGIPDEQARTSAGL